MKRIITVATIAAFLLIGGKAYGQFTMGAGYLNVTERIDNTPIKGIANGFYVGPTVHTNLMGTLSLNTGLYYSMLMSSEPFILDYDEVGSMANTKEHSLYVPFTANLSIVFNENFVPFIYAGPTLQMGLSSKTVYNADAGVEVATIDHYAQDGYGNRFNVLVGGGIGFEIMETVIFKAGYHLSLLNYYRGDEFKLSRNYIQAGLAFVF